METILDSGLSLASVQTCQVVHLIDIDYLHDRLAEMRAEWQEATGGDLTQVTLDLGALFDDLDRVIGGE